jgi:hypothetical protein
LSETATNSPGVQLDVPANGAGAPAIESSAVLPPASFNFHSCTMSAWHGANNPATTVAATAAAQRNRVIMFSHSRGEQT